MKEIRFHGRGGQGAVTAVELVAQAAIDCDLYAQGFPSFGAERRGAPVMAFLRISDSQIFLRTRIDSPDVVVVLDKTLVDLPEVTEGLEQGKTMIINDTPENRDQYAQLAGRYRLVLVDASRIAMDTIGVPITNTAIIGALLKATDITSPGSLEQPFQRRFGGLAEKNLAAMNAAYEQTVLADGPGSGSVPGQGEELGWDDYLRGEALLSWQDMEIGCDVVRPGSCREFDTGNWRTAGRPVLDAEKCISCGQCWIYCPEIAFSRSDGEHPPEWDGNYCKGCGICAAICPKKALSMEEEK
jgi:pyruvate ferredoxin oxidoreductase gamma subunit